MSMLYTFYKPLWAGRFARVKYKRKDMNQGKTQCWAPFMQFLRILKKQRLNQNSYIDFL